MDDGRLHVARRGAVGALLAAVALPSSRADACSIVGQVEGLEEIVSTMAALIVQRDAKRIEPLLADSFRFRAGIDDTPLDKKKFLSWVRAQPAANREGIRIDQIDTTDSQIVQREYIRFEDVSNPQTPCGNLFNYSARIAVYDVQGNREGQGIVPCIPGASCSVQYKPFYGALIAGLHHIALPFTRAD